MSEVDKFTGGVPAATEFCDITLFNYNKWLFKMVKRHLGKRVLELGAGTGRFSKFLMEENLKFLLLIEPSPVFFQELSKVVDEKNFVRVVNNSIESFDDSSIFQSFDSIVSIQALEHIENDEIAISKTSEYLRHGGKIIIQVPAMKWLFGHWDRQIGHYRRYEKTDVLRISKATGLKICESYYFNLTEVLGWWLNFCSRKYDFRKSSDSKKLNLQGAFFDKWLVPIVSGVESIIRPPIGIGLHFVLQKS